MWRVLSTLFLATAPHFSLGECSSLSELLLIPWQERWPASFGVVGFTSASASMLMRSSMTNTLWDENQSHAPFPIPLLLYYDGVAVLRRCDVHGLSSFHSSVGSA